MSTKKGEKLNQLLKMQPPGTVFISSYLEKKGYSHDLLRKYRKSGWLESIGWGAMKRAGEEITWQGALYSIQQYLKRKVIIGGPSSISIHGKAHFLKPKGEDELTLFLPPKEKLPKWFLDYEWNIKLTLHSTSILPYDIGIENVQTNTSYSLATSSAARALMECLFLVPDHFDLVEAYYVMESMASLPPKKVQKLLELCSSIKVKRLFLYLASKFNHPWQKQIKPHTIDLGSGKRTITKGGIYNDQFKLIVPETIEQK
jgi:hypothetical protein